MTLLVQESAFLRNNIGLVGASTRVPEALTLPSLLSSEINQGILTQAFHGMWYGAVAGFEIGQEFCGLWGNHAGKVHVNVHSGDATVALALLVLCGGGIVGGVSLGAAYGMVEPFVSSPHSIEISIAQERVIQGIWTKLISKNEGGDTSLHDVGSSSLMDRTPRRVRFGAEGQPFSAFMRIEPIQVGLFSKSKFYPQDFTLLWNIRVIYFDGRQRIVAKHIIEIEQGEYTFDEWAANEATLLKEKLGEGSQLVADHILGELTPK